ncbi:MAG: TetR/AcrR family transcriptional regulator [Ilumatobacter sp.]|uniref:TetR/AcrR family transcriptional regulator n=1 Tax=Ilumatobacter sp. TaxID=1967498 RepID=UPI00329A4D26
MVSRSASPPTSKSARAGRRGRLPADERDDRRAAVIEAAFAELLERGADGVTMLAIARRAGASKETLYSWFGSRDGLLSAMIVSNADATADRIATALGGGDLHEPRETLAAFGAGLLRLLTDPRSLALNRAAMTNSVLAGELLASGRHRVGPLVESYLASIAASGMLDVRDPVGAFETFYGLIIRDTQIRVLLGESAPSAAAITRRAATGTDQFLALCELGVV